MTNRTNKRKKQDQSTGSESDFVENVQLEQELSADQKLIFSLLEFKMKKLVADLQGQLSSKDSAIQHLEHEVTTLRKRVMMLEDRVEDADSYERRDTVVVSGSEVPEATNDEDSSRVFINIVKNKVGINVKPSDISTAHRLGRKSSTQAPDKRSLIVKLCRRELKHDLMKACKTVRPNNIYINENLTKTRSTALYAIRQAKKKYPEKISGCSSFDGRVYAWIKPPSADGRSSKMLVNSRERFSELCVNILKCSPSEVFNDWPNQ